MPGPNRRGVSGWLARSRRSASSGRRRGAAIGHVWTIRLAWHDTVERTYSTPRIDKLGVRPGVRVAIVGRSILTDALSSWRANEDVTTACRNRTPISSSWPPRASPNSLMPRSVQVRPNGAIWVDLQKGTRGDAPISDSSNRRRRAASSTKGRGFSETHTALRWVIPRRAPAADLRASTIRTSDILLILLVVLVVVLVWRGPKTLPKLGQALGRGVREARREVEAADPDKPETPD